MDELARRWDDVTMQTRTRVQESAVTTFTVRSRHGVFDDVVMETVCADDGNYLTRAFRIRQECHDGVHFTKERGLPITILDSPKHPEMNLRHAHFLASEIFLFGIDTDDEIKELFQP